MQRVGQQRRRARQRAVDGSFDESRRVPGKTLGNGLADRGRRSAAARRDHPGVPLRDRLVGRDARSVRRRRRPRSIVRSVGDDIGWLLAARPANQIAQQALQFHERGHVHHHRDVARDVAPPHGKVDVDEQHASSHLPGGGGRLKKRVLSPRSTSGSDIFRCALQRVRDRRQAAVEDHVAGLGERFLLELDDVFVATARPRPATARARGCSPPGKINNARPTMAPSNVWCTATRSRDSRSPSVRIASLAAQQRHLRHGQQDLLADHDREVASPLG